MNKINQIIGCIVGGAIGDGFGSAYEGKNLPFTINKNYPWKISDDTQLTLATCEAIIKAGKIDPAIIAETFAEWFTASRFSGVGASTLKALTELAIGGHWALVGRKGEMAAGNGAAMRIAPLAFCLNPIDLNSRVTIRDVCRITHHNEEAYVGALAVLISIQLILDQAWKGDENLIEKVVTHLPDSSVRDRLKIILESEKDSSIAEIAKKYGNSGYVVETIPLVLYAVEQINKLGFEKLLEELISVGGDTDTIASIAGQILGTLIGYENLPQEMLARIPDFEMIFCTATKFAEAVGNVEWIKN
jgi:ADP-ribosyl-[dinitrogen reductase] hydrolase